jgi:molybdenum cofactor biosynthesis enzyme MoaA
MLDKVELFGKDVPLKTHSCAFFSEEPWRLNPTIDLYIRTKFCNAKCKFCIYADDASKYNEKKFVEILKEMTSKIKIRKIAISGGEPTLYWNNFKNIINHAKEWSPDSELSMNTDGFRLKKLFDDPDYKLFDHIHISRHHWDDKINDEIFGTKTPTGEELKEIASLGTTDHQIQFRTNLIKGYIDTKEKVFEFLDWSNEVGINTTGLVSLMPVNDYSKDNFIWFHIKELIGERFTLTKNWTYKGACECFNYIYMPPEDKFRRPIRVYHKNTYGPSDIVGTLVFDGQNLRQGFDGDIII